MMTFAKVRRFIAVADAAVAVRDSDASWETKFEVVFSEAISGRILQTGIEFDWCDPDTDYEDDVRAFVDAVERKAKDLRRLPMRMREECR